MGSAKGNTNFESADFFYINKTVIPTAVSRIGATSGCVELGLFVVSRKVSAPPSKLGVVAVNSRFAVGAISSLFTGYGRLIREISPSDLTDTP